MDQIQGKSGDSRWFGVSRAAVVLLQFSSKLVWSQAQQRWQQIINEELIKGPWTAEEDQKVQQTHCKMDGREDLFLLKMIISE